MWQLFDMCPNSLSGIFEFQSLQRWRQHKRCTEYALACLIRINGQPLAFWDALWWSYGLCPRPIVWPRVSLQHFQDRSKLVCDLALARPKKVGVPTIVGWLDMCFAGQHSMIAKQSANNEHHKQVCIEPQSRVRAPPITVPTRICSTVCVERP